MNWPSPSPARSLSLVVGEVFGGDLMIKKKPGFVTGGQLAVASTWWPAGCGQH